MKHVEYFHMGQWPAYVGFTTSPKAFRKELKRLGIKDEVPFAARDRADAATHFLTRECGKTCCIVTMPPRGDRTHSQYAALVAHEAMHVVQEFRREFNRGEPFGDEADAYLIQSIVQNILQQAFDGGLIEISTEPSAGQSGEGA